MAAAVERLTPVILELGGKDPFIVFDDASLAHVVDIAIRRCVRHTPRTPLVTLHSPHRRGQCFNE